MSDRFIIGNNYRLYVLGFTNPVEGEIKDIEVSKDGSVILSIEETSGDMINILVAAITGVTDLPKIPKGKAA